MAVTARKLAETINEVLQTHSDVLQHLDEKVEAAQGATCRLCDSFDEAMKKEIMPAIVEVIADGSDQGALVDLIMALAKHLGVTEDQFAKVAAKVRDNAVDRGDSFSAKVAADRSKENRASVAGKAQSPAWKHSLTRR
jgi:hypothetical protein